MIVAANLAELWSVLEHRGRTLVPTMGALHDGHGALIEAAVSRGAPVVVSIFVNPLQFGAGEDLERYPRTLDADLDLCERHGADVVFTPSTDVVYPDGAPQLSIDPGPLGAILEGASRPGHFAGMLAVVAKLFNLVRPDTALFGDKDYQQLALIRRLVIDLSMPVEVAAIETVRDADGLALSSRNRYLSAHERELALSLSRSLRAGREAGAQGPHAVVAAAQAVFDEVPEVDVDYLSLRAVDLSEPPPVGDARLLVAARVGSTRLIDNGHVRLG